MPSHFEAEQSHGRLTRLVESLRELSLLGKLAVTAGVLNAAAVTAGGAEILSDKTDELTYGYLGVNSGFVVATIGAALYNRHQRNKPGERDFSRHESFNPSYTHTAEDGGIYDSPFAVTVLGIHHEVLGAGKLIGGLGEGDDAMPVIAVQDEYAKNGEVELLGSECWWAPIDEEIVDALATDRDNTITTPASYYVRTLG